MKSPSFPILGSEGKFNILLALTPKYTIKASVEGEGVTKGQKLSGKLEIKYKSYKDASTNVKFGCEKSGYFVEDWNFYGSDMSPYLEGCWSLDATIIAPGNIVVTEGISQEIKNSAFT